MFLFFAKIALSFEEYPVAQILNDDWNAELIQTGPDGRFISQKLYSAKMIPNEKQDNIVIKVYEGDFPFFEANETDTRTPIMNLNFELKSKQNGTLIESDDQYELAEINFVDTLGSHLGAYGLFNGSYRYAIGIVNLATIHISIYSYDPQEYYELILTRTQRPSGIDWFSKYQSYIIGAVFFVLALGYLELVPIFMRKIGKKDTTPLEKKMEEDEKKARDERNPVKKSIGKKTKKE
ncbi:hypothetical protein TVAG_303300 [Trichomonas vaginalis G3]|uniref:Uncharacterized protein n=1 Tax=Trichomonas vaginalis (strain ATCC PRA-98 / G3) TaxID=412133 RepID=A2DR12_TRIV3|nr:hypothetical protein TVAGG3_0694520 [Trichomonas vaginalis G3]EAY17111.1 hypothetical protein TVAG_303300 [Trichomonas vaginalis G3]KAI5508821.1 hypothetical protein TVAGG3_0694520 [Trichomonas vaginalis G3]|eukprot:XP_001329334.1 hypothetical protein [Trichomonas vaginalis G3]